MILENLKFCSIHILLYLILYVSPSASYLPQIWWLYSYFFQWIYFIYISLWFEVLFLLHLILFWSFIIVPGSGAIYPTTCLLIMLHIVHFQRNICYIGLGSFRCYTNTLTIKSPESSRIVIVTAYLQIKKK
jgi:hypothetical protein